MFFKTYICVANFVVPYLLFTANTWLQVKSPYQSVMLCGVSLYKLCSHVEKQYIFAAFESLNSKNTILTSNLLGSIQLRDLPMTCSIFFQTIAIHEAAIFFLPNYRLIPLFGRYIIFMSRLCTCYWLDARLYVSTLPINSINLWLEFITLK